MSGSLRPPSPRSSHRRSGSSGGSRPPTSNRNSVSPSGSQLGSHERRGSQASSASYNLERAKTDVIEVDGLTLTHTDTAFLPASLCYVPEYSLGKILEYLQIDPKVNQNVARPYSVTAFVLFAAQHLTTALIVNFGYSIELYGGYRLSTAPDSNAIPKITVPMILKFRSRRIQNTLSFRFQAHYTDTGVKICPKRGQDSTPTLALPVPYDCIKLPTHESFRTFDRIQTLGSQIFSKSLDKLRVPTADHTHTLHHIMLPENAARAWNCIPYIKDSTDYHAPTIDRDGTVFRYCDPVTSKAGEQIEKWMLLFKLVESDLHILVRVDCYFHESTATASHTTNNIRLDPPDPDVDANCTNSLTSLMKEFSESWKTARSPVSTNNPFVRDVGSDNNNLVDLPTSVNKAMLDELEPTTSATEKWKQYKQLRVESAELGERAVNSAE